jgi:hypothetical protein
MKQKRIPLPSSLSSPLQVLFERGKDVTVRMFLEKLPNLSSKTNYLNLKAEMIEVGLSFSSVIFS